MAAFICCRCKKGWIETIGVDAPLREAIDKCHATRSCPGSTYLQIEPRTGFGLRWEQGMYPYQRQMRSFTSDELEAFLAILPPGEQPRLLPRPQRERGSQLQDLLEPLLRKINPPPEWASANATHGTSSSTAAASGTTPVTTSAAGVTRPPNASTVTAAANSPVPVAADVISRREGRLWETGGANTHCDVDGLEKTRRMIGVVGESSGWFVYQVRAGDRGICLRCQQPFQAAIGCGGNNGACRRAICMNCAPAAITNRGFMPQGHCCLVPPEATIPAGQEVGDG